MVASNIGQMYIPRIVTTTEKNHILVVGLNPAWQKVLNFSQFKIGEVNRAKNLWEEASGKGLNVARLLATHHNSQIKIHLLQVLGGAVGQRIHEACQELGVTSHPLWQTNHTRTCTTICDVTTNTVTECIDPFSVEKNTVLQWPEELVNQNWNVVAISGSYPSGLSAQEVEENLSVLNCGDLYIDSIDAMSVPMLLKSSLIKMNEDEWFKCQAAWQEARNKGALPQIMITRGHRPAWWANATDGMYQPVEINLPDIHGYGGVKNPIGGGDAVFAGLIQAKLNSLGATDSIVQALSWGMAKCTDVLPAHFESATADAIKNDFLQNWKQLSCELNLDHPFVQTLQVNL